MTKTPDAFAQILSLPFDVTLPPARLRVNAFEAPARGAALRPHWDATLGRNFATPMASREV